MRRSPKTRKEYNLPMDKTTKIITATGILGCIFPISVFAYFGIFSEPIILAIAVSILTFPIIIYLYSPKKVILEEDRIVIKRILGVVEIPYVKIKEITRINKPKMLRVFGSGGFFGYFGIFKLEGETAQVYSKRSRDFVLIKADKLYLIAPKNPVDFIKDINHIHKH